MYTESVIRVIRKVTFSGLEALAKNDNQLEAMWNFADNGFKALLIDEVLNDAFNEWGLIPELDSILEKLEKNYPVYMNNCRLRACLTDCWGDNDNDGKAILVIVPMTFNDIRRELNKTDKTAFELVRLVRRHTTKERLMTLIADRIEPDHIPTMENIAAIIKSVTDKYLDANSIWS